MGERTASTLAGGSQHWTGRLPGRRCLRVGCLLGLLIRGYRSIRSFAVPFRFMGDLGAHR